MSHTAGGDFNAEISSNLSPRHDQEDRYNQPKLPGACSWRRGLVVRRLLCVNGKGEEHRRQLQAEQRSGKWDFGDQPALFAVAQAVVKNDQEAIRVAAKALPDLQAPGRDGTTLLYLL